MSNSKLLEDAGHNQVLGFPEGLATGMAVSSTLGDKDVTRKGLAAEMLLVVVRGEGGAMASLAVSRDLTVAELVRMAQARLGSFEGGAAAAASSAAAAAVVLMTGGRRLAPSDEATLREAGVKTGVQVELRCLALAGMDGSEAARSDVSGAEQLRQLRQALDKARGIAGAIRAVVSRSNALLFENSTAPQVESLRPPAREASSRSLLSPSGDRLRVSGPQSGGGEDLVARLERNIKDLETKLQQAAADAGDARGRLAEEAAERARLEQRIKDLEDQGCRAGGAPGGEPPPKEKEEAPGDPDADAAALLFRALARGGRPGPDAATLSLEQLRGAVRRLQGGYTPVATALQGLVDSHAAAVAVSKRVRKS